MLAVSISNKHELKCSPCQAWTCFLGFFFFFCAFKLLSWRCFKCFKKTNNPHLRSFFVVALPTLVILSRCEYVKLCVFTSVCMTHASVSAAWISLPGFFFGVLDLLFELLILLLSIEDCSFSHMSLCLLWCLLSFQARALMKYASFFFYWFQSVLKGFCIYQPCLPPSSPRVHLAQPLSVGLIFWFPCFNFVADVVQSHGAVFMENSSLSTPISAPQFRGFRRASEISIASQVSGMADSYTASNIANSKCFTPSETTSRCRTALTAPHTGPEPRSLSVCLSVWGYTFHSWQKLRITPPSPGFAIVSVTRYHIPWRNRWCIWLHTLEGAADDQFFPRMYW